MEEYKLFKLSTYKEASLHILISLLTWLISVNIKNLPYDLPIQKLYFYGLLVYIFMQTLIIFNDSVQIEEIITQNITKYKIYYLILSISQGFALHYLFTMLGFSVAYFIATLIGCLLLLFLIMNLLPLEFIPCYPSNYYLNTLLTITIPNILILIIINYYVKSIIITNIVHWIAIPLFFIANLYLYVYNLNKYMLRIYKKEHSIEVNTYKFLINSYFYVIYLLLIYYAIPLAKMIATQF